ncbi:hypothetical protein L484_024780 [Morus notabilis]|uniref:Uncharacterized protein n=1 Tax=Morus notabilis TaxID=981085 RepID=W9QWC6_9ROSA|nr:uncharacterized protein LOC21407506 [Morus notabilis]EXB56243.1 hypothetical protein L484_024780 [Morus notabilis]
MGSCCSRIMKKMGVRRQPSSKYYPSQYSHSDSADTAKVISMDGALRQYATPVLVSQVLASAQITSSSSSSSSSISYFLCNSDSLYYDELIPSLSFEEQLRPNQIYFLLPESKRQQPLSAVDMASLAVKASAALNTNGNIISNSSVRRRNKAGRVSPLISMFNGRYHKKHVHVSTSEDGGAGIQYVHPQDYEYDLTIGLTGRPIKKKNSTASHNNNNNSSNIRMTRSGSVRKLQRFASRRAKLAVRSFRLRLTTIYEGTILS